MKVQWRKVPWDVVLWFLAGMAAGANGALLLSRIV